MAYKGINFNNILLELKSSVTPFKYALAIIAPDLAWASNFVDNPMTKAEVEQYIQAILTDRDYSSYEPCLVTFIKDLIVLMAVGADQTIDSFKEVLVEELDLNLRLVKQIIEKVLATYNNEIIKAFKIFKSRYKK